ncbi:hypothetical protein [Nostoc sp.]|uniref:hypothetical protein n=1 Tax=Nostoc sp. TaxID=1180 RepID=UPI002FF48825
MKNYYNENKNENPGNATVTGVVLLISTIVLIFMINYFPKGASRTVSSFVAGMFGFTAIQALRRGFDE